MTDDRREGNVKEHSLEGRVLKTIDKYIDMGFT